MQWNIVNKSLFEVSVPLSRLDAEYVMPSLLFEEERLRKFAGEKLSSIVGVYDGPQINDSYKDSKGVLNYISIDSIDTEDGLTYCERILSEDLPSRAAYELKTGDIIVSNVRPNRGGVALITGRNAGST